MIRYHPTAGDKHGWAIDEDRRLIRRALRDTARESAFWCADVVHAPFWMVLSMHHPQVLRRKFVIAHADNPPFFYLTQPEFAAAQQSVDLWVARSRESVEQFDALGLRSEHVPYAIDETVFFPIQDRSGLRVKYGIPRDAYVIGNFHRDSEGRDLAQPKLQKAPETFVAILRALRAQELRPHVLLAGPRRHWIRTALAREAIPFTFVGKQGIEGDDFGSNILSRAQLNELYNACDLYLVPSRWEGGPQSAMEAAAARVKILSFPLGVARDVLRPESMFDTHSQAAAKIARDMRDGFLESSLDEQRRTLLANHTSAAMARGLRRVYEKISGPIARRRSSEGTKTVVADLLRETGWEFRRRLPPRLPRSVRVVHESGIDSFMDEVVDNLVCVLGKSGIRADGGAQAPTVAGYGKGKSLFRLLPAGGSNPHPEDPACRIALSAQDAVNFKATGSKAPVVVCPLVFEGTGDKRPTLVVDEEDRTASSDVWRCMHDGGVVVYPRRSAYYYQAFHAGVAYGEGRSRAEALELAAGDAEVMGALGRPPSRERAELFWKTLLSRRA